MRIRPHVRYFHSCAIHQRSRQRWICVAFGWNGDVFIARDRAREAGNGVEVGYFVPREGAILWVDVMAIPRDAPHPEHAHRFIDYVLRTDVIAAISNHVNYANAVPAADALLEPAVRDDPAIYPDAETRASSFRHLREPRARSPRDRAWTRIKTGH